ncbi:MAG: hypothetical protein NO126_01580, partial [Sulfolobales archaeon]|nr:hypothetical protein [Sulfolobales archaeon]
GLKPFSDQVEEPLSLPSTSAIVFVTAYAEYKTEFNNALALDTELALNMISFFSSMVFRYFSSTVSVVNDLINKLDPFPLNRIATLIITKPDYRRY